MYIYIHIHTYTYTYVRRLLSVGVQRETRDEGGAVQHLGDRIV